MKIAVIPARGGSRRIPKKNILKFCGKPMIAHAIETASKSRFIDRIIVSTDSKEVKAIAMEYGAEVPFMRPGRLSDDHTPTAPVVTHTLEELQNMGQSALYACCLYPCTPMVTNEDLDDVFGRMLEGDHLFAYPVVRYPHPIQRAMRMSSAGKMSFYHPENELARTQDFEVAYHDAGQFYWGTAAAWIGGKSMYTHGVGVPMPSTRFVDIDNIEDLKRAELIKQWREGGLVS